MLLGTEKEPYRNVYIEVWEKHQKNIPLEAYEKPILAVILEHPEFHVAFEHPEAEEWPTLKNTNPFMHMGLHMGIRDQINANTPNGITSIFGTIKEKIKDAHEAEHQMMFVLAETMQTLVAEAQPFDEMRYMKMLKELSESL